MKNITLSAQDQVIAAARKKAASDGTTLNSLFRLWLDQYASNAQTSSQLDELFGATSYVRIGRKLSRDDMNTH